MPGRAERALPWPAVYAIHKVMGHQDTITACALVIGNEVLSGRTRDANLNWLASRCTEMGIRLAEARVIPDVEDVIVDAINECRAKYTYVFTTGGIGPTHDDITAACIAQGRGRQRLQCPLRAAYRAPEHAFVSRHESRPLQSTGYHQQIVIVNCCVQRC